MALNDPNLTEEEKEARRQFFTNETFRAVSMATDAAEIGIHAGQTVSKGMKAFNSGRHFNKTAGASGAWIF